MLKWVMWEKLHQYQINERADAFLVPLIFPQFAACQPFRFPYFHIYQQFYLTVVEQFRSGTPVYLPVTLLFSLCVFLHAQNKTSGSNFGMVKSATKAVFTTHTLLPETLDI